ncbi:hypothetical protein [Bradyrhizobium sp. 157]|uniref:hypothetical protein n=1 Tax=Bradyrhizobium sp. 157 TaxID=2782631 RepID=UPI001FFBC927|nr:hypothetical protein [Bradyrhizobium sp. 157]
MKKAILIAVLLGGCDLTASQERATAERADNAQCSNYGLKPGTAEFAQCRMSMDQHRQARVGAALQQIDRNNREAADYNERRLARPTINCTGTTTGNTTNTTCR